MNSTKLQRIALLLVTAAALIGMTGCQNQRAIQERDALYIENEELRQQNNRLSSEVDALEQENQRLRQQLAERPEPQPQPQRPRGASANTPFSGIEGVEAEQTAGRVTVRVPGDVLFASGKASLRSSSESTLRQIANVITREYPDQVIRVEGYTDTDPIRKSNWSDNLELSLQRAAAVERYLMQQGVDADRMYSAGFGEANARGSKAKSRRVEIVVVLNEQ